MTPEPDPLTELFDAFTLHVRLAERFELSAPWGLAVPEGSAALYAMVRGSCQLTIPHAEVREELSRGDLIALPQPSGHRLQDAPGSPTVRIEDFIASRYTPGPEDHSGRGGTTALVACHLTLAQEEPSLLQSMLPPLIRIEGVEGRIAGWMESALGLMVREFASNGPGAQAIADRLAQVVFIRAVRAFLSELPDDNVEGLGALRDPDIGPALGLIHRHPEQPWTVGSLASRIAMSRSAFSARFTALVGKPPLQYLREHRMQKACRMLRDESLGLKEIATCVGFRSVAAFSHAFKQWAGIAPGSYRAGDRPARG